MAVDHTYTPELTSQYPMAPSDLPNEPLGSSAAARRDQRKRNRTSTFVYSTPSPPQRSSCAICCQVVLAACGCLAVLIGIYVIGMMGITFLGLPYTPLFATYDYSDDMDTWKNGANSIYLAAYNSPYTVAGTVAQNSSYHLEIFTGNVSISAVSSVRMCFEPSPSTSETVVGYGEVLVPVEVFDGVGTTSIPMCPSGGVSVVPGISICSNVTVFVSINTTTTSHSGWHDFTLKVELDTCDPMLEECACNYLLTHPLTFLIFIVAIVGPGTFLVLFCCCGSCYGLTCCTIGGCCCGCSGITSILSKPSPSSRGEYQPLL